MQRISITPEMFEGAVSLHTSDDGIAPVRLPVEQLDLFPSPGNTLVERAWSPAGARLRFATDTARIIVAVEPAQTGDEPRFFDLTRGAELVASVEIPSGGDRVEVPLADAPPEVPDTHHVYELWLPQFHPTRLTHLSIDDGASLRAARDRRPRWLTYGSSITMCRSAASPARTWPAVAARELDLDLLALGFGGQCHLEPMVARMIRDLDADVITLKVGINVYGGSTLSARTYPAAVIGLVKLIRERHPNTPIGVITSIASPERETEPNEAGLTLESYREMTRDAARRLQAAGDENLVVFEGTDLLGPDEAYLLPDGLHPGPEGYELMGRRVAELVLPRLLAMR
jgi:hypothetical protein